MTMKFSELPWLTVILLNFAGQPMNESLTTYGCDRTKSRWGWDRFVHWLWRNYFKRINMLEMRSKAPKLSIQFFFIKLIVSVQGSLFCLHIAKFKKEDNHLWSEGPVSKVRQIHSFQCMKITSKCIGLFFRTGLDTKYVLLNDDETGLLTYVGNFPWKQIIERSMTVAGKKHSKIQFVPGENQWRIQVMNNPNISATSYASINTKAIGRKSMKTKCVQSFNLRIAYVGGEGRP